MSEDEAIVVTHHVIQTSDGPLRYEARAGRLAIRNDESNSVLGYIFFVAYVRENASGEKRPLLFAWNGGPGSDSLLVHIGLFGPRRLDGEQLIDNAETILKCADLVVYDAMGTGFSRLSTPTNSKYFYSTTGDFAVTAEFIRAYRARFSSDEQPLVLAGESMGTWRAVGTAELLEQKGISVSGLILISGGPVGIPKTFAFEDAMFVPARAEAALYLHKLAPSLMRDPTATRADVADWSEHIYWPALEHPKMLKVAERRAIIARLSSFTGVGPEHIDRKTLVMTNTEFRNSLAGAGRVLDSHDMRVVGEYGRPAGAVRSIQKYLRIELGYAADLAYIASLQPLETSFMTKPGGKKSDPNEGWEWNQARLTPEMERRMDLDGAPPPGAQPWLQNALLLNPRLEVFIATGYTDPQESCLGNALLLAKLPREQAQRFINRCYEGGHMMYRVETTRRQLLDDLQLFVTRDLAH